MKHTKAVESDVVGQMKTIAGVEKYDKEKLTHVQTVEKNVLPDTTALAAEREHHAHVTGIESFNKEGMKNTHTTEKNVLPDKATINQEKTIKNIEDFNKDKLKHSETVEKNPLPTKESEYIHNWPYVFKRSSH